MKHLSLYYLAVLVILVLNFTSCEKNEDVTDLTSLSGRLACKESYLLLDLALPVALKTEYIYTDGKLTGKKFYYKKPLVWESINTTVEEYLKPLEWVHSHSETLSYYPDSIVIKRIVDNETSTDLYPGIYSGKDIWKYSNGRTTEMLSYGNEYGQTELATEMQYNYEGNYLKLIVTHNTNGYPEYYKKEVFSYLNNYLSTVENYSSNDNNSYSLNETESYSYVENKLNEIEYDNGYSPASKTKLIYQGDKITKQEFYWMYDNNWLINRYSELQESNNQLIIKQYWTENSQFKLYETSKWIMEEGVGNWDDLYKIMANPKAALFINMYPGF